MIRSLAITAISVTLALCAPAFAQVQLDHNTAQALTDLGINTSQVKQQDDIGYINQIGFGMPTRRPRKPKS